MSLPWIIWTLQRSGSIALFEALRKVTEPQYRLAESEPFDGSVETRQFSAIAALPPAEWPARLDAICQSKWCLKHVYDRLPLEFNLALAAATSKAGYQHIYLIRLNEFARLVSLGVAENEATWLHNSFLTHKALDEIRQGKRTMRPIDVPSLMARSRVAMQMWSQIGPHLTRLEVVRSEKLTSRNKVVRGKVLRELFAHLELPFNSIAKAEAHLETSGQGTFGVWNRVQNLDQLRTAIIA